MVFGTLNGLGMNYLLKHLQFLGSIFIIIGAGIFIVAINPRLGLASLIPAAALLIFTKLVSGWVKEKNTKNLQANGAMSAEIAADKDSVIEKLFKDKRINVTKRNLELAYDWAVKEARLRGNVFKPNSVWGMVCGLTRVSQECGWADERVAMDQAAGKLLTMAG